MPLTTNRWPVLTPGSKLLRTAPCPGGIDRRLTGRREALPLFLAFTYDYNDWIATVDKGITDEGIYAYRESRVPGAGWSAHSGGVALDINWSKEGAQNSANGKKFFAVPEHAKSVDWLKELYGFEWGGDWDNYLDYMHWQLPTGSNVAWVEARIRKLGITPAGVRYKDAKGKRLAEPRGLAA